MKNNSAILKLSLLAGSFYFLFVSIAHLSGLKFPGLYIYFQIPSYAFQDKIVALFALGWAIFFFTAFTDPVKNITLVRGILFAGAFAIIILCFINITTNFYLFNNSVNPGIIWLETILLFVYWLWLVVFYFLVKKDCI